MAGTGSSKLTLNQRADAAAAFPRLVTGQEEPDATLSGRADSSAHSRRSRLPLALSIALGDVVAFLLSVLAGGFAAYLVSSYAFGAQYLGFEHPLLFEQLLLIASVMGGICVWFARTGHYTERRLFREDLAGTWDALLIGLLINGFVQFASKAEFSRLWLGFAWLFAALAIPVARVATRWLLNLAGLWVIRAVIIGEGSHRAAVAASLSRDRYLGYHTINDGSLATYAERASSVGGERLESLLAEADAQTVLLVPKEAELQYLAGIIDALNVRMIPYFVVPPIDKLPLAGLSTQSFLSSDAVLLTVRQGLTSPLSQSVKRLFDIVASLVLLIALSPLFAIVAVLVTADGGPVFFAHERIGRAGRRFKCLKFRTMVPNAAAVLEAVLAQRPEARREWMQTHKLRNDPRTTGVGGWLRATSIDELPQLINVLRGEMSLVGPRPVVEQELHEHYKSDNSYYLLVRPGVTGLWQVSGRSDTDYARRVHLDAWYVRNWTLWSDIIILWRTLPAVIFGRGAY